MNTVILILAIHLYSGLPRAPEPRPVIVVQVEDRWIDGRHCVDYYRSDRVVTRYVGDHSREWRSELGCEWSDVAGWHNEKDRVDMTIGEAR